MRTLSLHAADRRERTRNSAVAQRDMDEHGFVVGSSVNAALLHMKPGHADLVSALALSPDCRLLATGDRGGVVHAWGLHHASMASLPAHRAPIAGLGIALWPSEQEDSHDGSERAGAGGSSEQDGKKSTEEVQIVVSVCEAGDIQVLLAPSRRGTGTRGWGSDGGSPFQPHSRLRWPDGESRPVWHRFGTDLDVAIGTDLDVTSVPFSLPRLPVCGRQSLMTRPNRYPPQVWEAETNRLRLIIPASTAVPSNPGADPEGDKVASHGETETGSAHLKNVRSQ